jgi:hypothetical protein
MGRFTAAAVDYPGSAGGQHPVSNPGVQDREYCYGSDAIAASGAAILSATPAAGKI